MANSTFKTITVFCGSADSVDAAYLDAAAETGRLLALRGVAIVYGAGKTGLMGVLARHALAAGGQVIGIIPANLNTPQLAQAGLTRLEVSVDIQQRKARMSSLAEAFITLPGGYGTLDEFFETLTWGQIGLHHKPVGLLNTCGYYDPLLDMVDHACAEGFIYKEHRRALIAEKEPAALLDALEHYIPPQGINRWIERPVED